MAATPARVAYAWLLGQANRSTTALVPIIGASTGQQVQGTLAAADLVLSAEHLAGLEAVSRIRLGEPHDYDNFHADLTEGGKTTIRSLR